MRVADVPETLQPALRASPGIVEQATAPMLGGQQRVELRRLGAGRMAPRPGMEHPHGKPYHPMTQGKIERLSPLNRYPPRGSHFLAGSDSC